MELVLMVCLLGLTMLMSGGLVLAARASGQATRWESRARRATLALLLSGIGMLAWSTFYRADSVSLAEFSAVSLRPPPASARVVDKNLPHLDFYGDACSYSKIELSGPDYAALLAQLEADRRLRSGIDSAAEGVHSARKRAFVLAGDARRRSLQFLGDGRSIEVNICLG